VHATSFAGEWIEESHALMSSDLAVLLTRIGEIDLSLCVALGACSSSNDEFAFAAADRYHTFLTVTNNREERMRAYEYVVSRLPTSKETPQYMIEWASFCANVLGLNSKSLEILEAVFNDYPGSDVANLAHVRHGLMLYEDEKYEDAYLSVQEVLASSATSSEGLTAQFVSALCESAMGLDEESENHMYEIVEGHPTSQIAPRALFWLGSNALSSMEYEKAEEIFRDLVSRFPDSEYAEKATGYVGRLSEMQDPGKTR
jgi:TolA-binding protein